MTLVTQIEEKRKEIHTDAYPMSIGELINLYVDGELDIHPEFQRIYRWTEVQKSRLIESILLGIPLPSFFVAQREDGVWDVVDGLQRLSTIFSFLGIYKNETGDIEPPLILKGTEYLPALEGIAWNENTSPDNFFSVDLQRAFKREKVDLKIIKKESDDQTKYELFQRLNTFGSSLSDQEVRNCLLIMIDKTFFEWIKELGSYQPFLSTLTITSRQFDEQYHLELAVRFLILKDKSVGDLRGIPDIGDYITKQVKGIASNSDYDRESEAEKFKKTFDLLNKSLMDNAFRKFENDRYTGGFSLSIYEVMALGLGKNVENYDIENPEHIEKIVSVSKRLLQEERYTAKRGAGYKASDRLPHILPLGIELLRI
ncbi:DUF262 domain-containing protein [Pseudomonas syringae]|uniref:DUF262 domain-containing protein n=1 Tax=Pseudomonas syringae TaxID=317 RepID=UPI001F407884|nr:DUF262 domain-containing protein [Pseudomonas syringae]MCF8985113.1 DUF262 domain-containing protein [Pseudomonas syringae]